MQSLSAPGKNGESVSVKDADAVMKRLTIPCYSVRYAGDNKCVWRGVMARNPEEAERLSREWYLALNATEQPEVESVYLHEEFAQYGLVSIPSELADRLQKLIDEWMVA